MKRLYRDYLFQKHILVSEASDEKNAFEVVFSLANLFGIRIVSGETLAETAMISYVSEQLGNVFPNHSTEVSRKAYALSQKSSCFLIKCSIISERIGWETFLKQDIQYLKNNSKELHLRRT